MGILTGYDSAEPLAHPPNADVVAFYGGGDTPHVWTLPEIQAQKTRYRLPIWVRSNPRDSNVSVTVDVENFLIYLAKVGCPKGAVTVLDLETAVAPNYVTIFGQLMHSEGYLVLPYGSSGSLYKNPVLDGYWVDLPGARAIPSNCVGVQYSQGGGGAWDNDWFFDTLPFWDTQPAPIPGSTTTEGTMNCQDPTTGGTWVVDPLDGHVETLFGAPYLGALNEPTVNRYNWQASGVITGITPWKDPNAQWGYAIIIKHKTVLESGAWFSTYTFERNGSNK